VPSADYLVLDTDVASHLHRGRDLPDPYTKVVSGRVLCVTFVTVAEMWQWAHHREWGEPRCTALRHWLQDRVVVVPYDALVAEIWGRLCGEARRRGDVLPMNDAWIAACCVRHDLPLSTLNVKDFQRIPGLRLTPDTDL
jgi:predicted nucleic acid-binding protein